MAGGNPAVTAGRGGGAATVEWVKSLNEIVVVV